MNEAEWKAEAVRKQSLRLLECCTKENLNFSNETNRKKLIKAMRNIGYNFTQDALEFSMDWLKANKRIDEDGKIIAAS